MTSAAFNADLVTITRKRFSMTQGEVLVEYNGIRIEQYGDAIRLVGSEWQGMSDAEWIAIARREAIARGLATEPTPPAPCASAQAEPEIVAEVGRAPDGRQTLTVLRVNSPRNAYNPRRWTRVRNIDGSNDFMPDDGGWEFLPWENKPYMAAVDKALSAAAAQS